MRRGRAARSLVREVAQPGLDRKLVEELATLRFVEQRSNVLLIRAAGGRQDDARGGLGQEGGRVGLPRLLHDRCRPGGENVKAAAEGRWQATMRFWAGPGVLVVDGLGYLPLPGEAASHFFQVVSRRYEQGSIILTTNRGIAEWGEIFEDTTVAAVADMEGLEHA